MQTNYRRVKIDAETGTVAETERFSVESGPTGAGALVAKNGATVERTRGAPTEKSTAVGF